MKKIPALLAVLALPLFLTAEQSKNFSQEHEKVFTRNDGQEIIVGNQHLSLSFNRTDSMWNVVWQDVTNTAVRRVDFGVEVDGKNLQPKSAAAEVEKFSDKLGSGMQIRQRFGDEILIERFLRVYDGLPVVTLSARITNQKKSDATLGLARLVQLNEPGKSWWQIGDVKKAPASIHIVSSSLLQCLPASNDNEREYHSTGILALVNREPQTALIFGYLTAFEASPALSAKFRKDDGGVFLFAHENFLGRKLGPGESLDFDTVYLSANHDPYLALEKYGDAAACFAQQPVRKGATALWCSWYAHRMAMTEDLVLANAAVAAKNFKPLGFEIMQLDHGWQRGDVTGDWIPNERFPHGLKWLSQQLKKKYGLKLGVWIAPTDVAETSETFQKHRDWMLKGGDGKPLVNWKWYWKPNPNCYELDASNPAAAKWMEKVFSQLTDWGVSYYKIDFIAASGGEQFFQSNPKSTRGWSVMRSAMESVRRGAGPKAWIRYCQPPPLLSAGLADSAYGGDDTADAGLNGKIELLRSNARSLAAGYWLNDRLYHREVCDMSVRMQADIEEVRMRLVMMTLAGCSISFSDEFQFLPPSRIRMMQTALPPGNPPMKPLDLFDRWIPSVWQVHCKNDADEWDIVGLFNFENKPEERPVDFAALGLSPESDAAVFEFWEEKFLGVHKKNLTLTLPPQTSRILAIRKLNGKPQVIGTDMHELQGFHELKKLAWDDSANKLSGECERMPGVSGKVFIYLPEKCSPHFDFPLTKNSAALTHVDGRVWAREINFQKARESWSIPFDATAK